METTNKIKTEKDAEKGLQESGFRWRNIQI